MKPEPTRKALRCEFADVAIGTTPAQAGHLPAQRIKVQATRDHTRVNAYGSGKQPLGRASAGNARHYIVPV